MELGRRGNGRRSIRREGEGGPEEARRIKWRRMWRRSRRRKRRTRKRRTRRRKERRN